MRAGSVEGGKLEDALSGFQRVVAMEEGKSEWCAPAEHPGWQCSSRYALLQAARLSRVCCSTTSVTLGSCGEDPARLVCARTHDMCGASGGVAAGASRRTSRS